MSKNTLFFVIIALFTLFVSSCYHIKSNISIHQNNIIPPTSSFVKVEVTLNDTMFSSASGVIVDHIEDEYSIIMSAKHVCNKYKEDGFRFFVLDEEMNKFISFPIYLSKFHDVCLLGTDLRINKPKIRLATTEPVRGNAVYNIAAPFGMKEKNMSLIFHGFYSGKMKIGDEPFLLDVYTIPVKSGSSGSPILNGNWELIGIVSRGHSKFENIGIAVAYRYIHKIYRDILPNAKNLIIEHKIEEFLKPE